MRNFKYPNDVRGKIEVSIRSKNQISNLNQRGHLTITELGIEKKTQFLVPFQTTLFKERTLFRHSPSPKKRDPYPRRSH